MSKKKPLNRFMSKVQKTDTCWVWQGSYFNSGYGQFWLNNTNKLAHRVSYELFKGPIKDKLCVCHTCDNKQCVNPEHLWLGTHKENVADCYAKDRHPKTGRPRKTKLAADASYKDRWYFENRERIKAERKSGWSYLNKENNHD